MAGQFERLAKELEIPATAELVAELEVMAASNDAIKRCLAAVTNGIFVHPDGREDHLGDVALTPEQLGLLVYLAKTCPPGLSIDVGFGMGSSTTTILATRRALGKPFEHIVFDPYGLGRGFVVEDYIRGEFADHYSRVSKTSQVGLAQLVDERGPGTASLVFIDGSHTFEAVMTDFVMADLLCGVGGYIVFDDALFPAIESVVNYIIANRTQYAVSHLKVRNTTVIKKISPEQLNWDQFKPFAVPHRVNWTPLNTEAEMI